MASNHGGRRGIWRKIWPPAVVMLGLLSVWQASVSLGLFYSWIVPSPWAVVQESIKIGPRLAEHTGSTLRLTLMGFGFGAAGGFLLSMLLHLVPLLRSALYPLLILSQNVPLVVIAPLLTLLLGYGLLPKVLLVTMVCFFPVAIAMLSGLSGTDQVLLNYMRMIGSSKWQLFWRLELPYSINHLFSGLKIAATYSMLSAVVAEWISPKNGLGGFLILSSRSYKPERVFAAVIIIVAISLLLFGLVSLAERFIVRWRTQKEGGLQ
ncbi:ABC transporter permease [Paenibacillus sp. IITD108]|uniref:ABC transporter permease n=1 Tax=Paenibacillus sp. IITD108 TaxID=3116649 RepID=UPI002F404B97